ncbi:MAG: hypothetical protein ACRDPG_05885 [Nocardioidaceae bacterium]
MDITRSGAARRLALPHRRHRYILTVGALLLIVLGVPSTASAGVVPSSPAQRYLVSATPSARTPAVNDGAVRAIVQVGDVMVVGGTFTSVSEPSADQLANRSSLPRRFVFAFNVTTGSILRGFHPKLDGPVEALAVGPSNSVFVGGEFKHVWGYAAPGLVRISVSSGGRVASFKTPRFDNTVRTLARRGNGLFVGGWFHTVGGARHDGLVELSATTGAIYRRVRTQFTVPHNTGPTGVHTAVGVRALDVSPDGTRLVAIGNFRKVDGLSRVQIVMLDIRPSGLALDQHWSTRRFAPMCQKFRHDSYVRSVSFSPNGRYFVVTTSGGPHRGWLCDSASRWETHASGLSLQPTWVDSSGGDSILSVAVSDPAVYVGGHFRWLNNPDGHNRPAAGAVPRPSIAALDPINGLPLRWNPGRVPRGRGVSAMLLRASGLWIGSDTSYLGDRQYVRKRLARLPLRGGYAPSRPATPGLPGKVYLARSSGAVDRTFTGASCGPDRTAPSGTVPWGKVRGAFMLGHRLYYGLSNGTLNSRSFDGTTFGSPSVIDPYHDPVWDSVQTGSGQTFTGRFPSFNAELSHVSGMFFQSGRIYYALAGQPSLYYRYFSTDSGVVGQTRFVVSGGVDLSRSHGIFAARGRLYYVVGRDLRSVPFASGPIQPASMSSAPTAPRNISGNWSNRSMFLVTT